MTILSHALERYRGISVGFLLVLALALCFEISESWVTTVFALGIIFGAGILANKTSHHFHGHHHHAGDSTLDVVGIVVLFLANIFHPAFDGFTLHEAFVEQGVLAGLVVGGGIVLHEVLRQSALIALFATMRIRWYWVVLTASLGIAAGIGFGAIGATMLAEHEYLIDFITLFAYSFIVSEFYCSHSKEHKKQSNPFMLIGVCIGIVMMLFLRVH